MKKRYFLLLFLPFCNVGAVHAETFLQDHVVIAAVQTGLPNAAGDDFVVIHNPTDTEIDLNGWKLQYRAASATGSDVWSTKLSFACTSDQNDCLMTPHKNVVASTYNVEAVHSFLFSTGFSSAGGQLRLVKPDAVSTNKFSVVDFVGYGTAAESEGRPAPAPENGKVLLRKIDNEGGLIDSDDNESDFLTGCYKIDVNAVPVSIVCETATGSAGSNSEDGQSNDKSYSKIEVSELLPDPVSPAQDSSNEFIELYNPSAQDVNLEGYSIQAGADFRYHYTFESRVIPAGGYIVLYSSETGISLSNSGTSVRILDPNGNTISNVTYHESKPGQAWANISGVWQWTAIPTPGAVNEPSPAEAAPAAAAPAIKATKSVKATTAKVLAAKASAAPKVQAKKVSASPKATSAKSTTKKPSSGQAQSESSNNISYWLYGALGAGLLGYAGYEYREDVSRIGRRIAQAVGGRSTSSSSQQLPETTTLQMD